MNLLLEIELFHPCNNQEKKDRQFMISYIRQFEDYLERENQIGHFTASAWIINKERTKTLMIYHKIYDSWSWVGGHADGKENLREVAIREVREETGVKNIKLLSEDIFSLEILTVDGHEKNGKYVSSHLHFNVTYLMECDEKEMLIKNEEETRGVRWCRLEEIHKLVSEPWMMERIYEKLMKKTEKFSSL